MTKKQKKQLAEYLEERWDIYCASGRPEDLNFYNGIIRTVEILGYSWERKENRTHIIY